MTVLLDEHDAYDVAALAAKYKVLVSRTKHRTVKRKATEHDIEQALGYIQEVRAKNIPHWLTELAGS